MFKEPCSCCTEFCKIQSCLQYIDMYFVTGKSCGFPGYFPQGLIHGRSYRYMDTIHYYCNHGYKQIGNPVRVCMANGEWSGEVPVCEG